MIKNPALLSNLFSQSFLKKTISGNHLPYINLVLKETNFRDQLNSSSSVSSALLDVFNYLKDNYRCEYIYKSAILSELLLKKHSFKHSTYITEFRTFNAKADIVILNGTSTVYELKSDVDNLNRLVNQIGVYEKVFEKVFVVSNKNNVNKLNSLLPPNIGILVVKENLTIKTIRDASSNLHKLDKSMMFDSLRRPEYFLIINDAFGFVPDVPSTLIHAHCKNLFNKLTKKDAHFYFLNALKNRKLGNEQTKLINTVNISLKAILAENKYSDQECNRISLAITKTLN